MGKKYKRKQKRKHQRREAAALRRSGPTVVAEWHTVGYWAAVEGLTIDALVALLDRRIEIDLEQVRDGWDVATEEIAAERLAGVRDRLYEVGLTLPVPKPEKSISGTPPRAARAANKGKPKR